MERWIGKVALVTGASVGIGAAIATKLVDHGLKVVGCARNLEKLNEIASKANKAGKGEMFPHQCDLSNEDEILGMFRFIKEKFGVIHICVNNAGLGHKASLLEGKTSEWREMFDINVLALSIVTRESVALMRAKGVNDGHIINISSISGHRVSGLHMYSASKFAVRAITESLRRELREIKSNIRVTGVSPGMVETEFSYRMNKDDPQKAADAYSSMKCLTSDDVANTVVFIVTSPAHMEVNDVIIRPVEQKM